MAAFVGRTEVQRHARLLEGRDVADGQGEVAAKHRQRDRAARGDRHAFDGFAVDLRVASGARP